MGDRTIRKSYNLREMPLFVRSGSLIPLGAGLSVPDSDVTFLTFRAGIAREYVVKLCL